MCTACYRFLNSYVLVYALHFKNFLNAFLLPVIMVSFIYEMYFIGLFVKFLGTVVLPFCCIISSVAVYCNDALRQYKLSESYRIFR
jgi:hypothetical protein